MPAVSFPTRSSSASSATGSPRTTPVTVSFSTASRARSPRRKHWTRCSSQNSLKLDAVLELRVDQTKLVDRIIKRAEDAKAAGQPVRKDDDPEVFKQRLEAYNRDTAVVVPLLREYRPAFGDRWHAVHRRSVGVHRKPFCKVLTKRFRAGKRRALSDSLAGSM